MQEIIKELFSPTFNPVTLIRCGFDEKVYFTALIFSGKLQNHFEIQSGS